MHPTDRKTLFYGIITGLIIIVLTIIGYPILRTWMVIIIAVLLLKLVPLVEKLQKFAQREKRDYGKIKNYPDLICKKHLSRTLLQELFVYKNIQCRINGDCDENDIINTKLLIGVIGKSIIHTNENNYYINIWSNQEEKVTDGDFDIIEIHKSKEIENYDKVIDKVVRFFFNEVNRYKPISQMIVKIFGNIELTENTKRLLETHFLKVEYVIDDYKK